MTAFKTLAPRIATLLLLTFATTESAEAQDRTMRVGCWNLESGDADIGTLTTYLQGSGTPGTVDLWGFSEVHPDWPVPLEAALDRHGSFRLIVGTTGGGDRLVIAFNEARFELIASGELSAINIGGHVRAPLFARLRNRASGEHFILMVNHLYRTHPEDRLRQATMLNQWAAQQSWPVVMIGDYNLDIAVRGHEERRYEAFDRLTANGTLRWVRPATLRRTQCGSSYQSVLDFVFVGGPARHWHATSQIEDSNPAFCPDDHDTSTSSDHRPVIATFATSTASHTSELQKVLPPKRYCHPS